MMQRPVSQLHVWWRGWPASQGTPSFPLPQIHRRSRVYKAKVWWPRTWTSTCAVTAYEGPGAGESPATMSRRHQLCWGPRVSASVTLPPPFSNQLHTTARHLVIFTVTR